jgi:hypothetical protein
MNKEELKEEYENFPICSTRGPQVEKHCVRRDLIEASWIHVGQDTVYWEVAECVTRSEEVEMAVREYP